MAKKKSKIIMIALALVSTLVLAPQALARTDGGGDQPASSAAYHEVFRDRVEQHRQIIQLRMDKQKAAPTERLNERRLAACDKREARINAIFDRSTAHSEKHLAVFQKIEERVTQFYEDKGLSAPGYEATLAAADEKEAAAIAAIEASKSVEFDCKTTDGTRPGNIIKETVRSRHQALKAYRTAIKDLIVVVKQSLADAETDTNKEEQ